MSEPVPWTTIVVGRDGEVFDLGEREYPPQTRDGKPYIAAFGQTVPVAMAEKLKRMDKKDVLRLYS